MFRDLRLWIQRLSRQAWLLPGVIRVGRWMWRRQWRVRPASSNTRSHIAVLINIQDRTHAPTILSSHIINGKRSFQSGSSECLEQVFVEVACWLASHSTGSTQGLDLAAHNPSPCLEGYCCPDSSFLLVPPAQLNTEAGVLSNIIPPDLPMIIVTVH